MTEQKNQNATKINVITNITIIHLNQININLYLIFNPITKMQLIHSYLYS